MDINYSYVGNFISKSELRNFGRLIELIIKNNTKDSVEFGDRLNDEFINGAINNFFEESLIEPLGIVGAIENAISQKLFTILDELDMEDHEAGIYADLLNEYGEVEMFYDIFNLETYDIIKNTVKYIIDNNLITESKQTFNKLYTSINEFKQYLDSKSNKINEGQDSIQETDDEIFNIKYLLRYVYDSGGNGIEIIINVDDQYDNIKKLIFETDNNIEQALENFYKDENNKYITLESWYTKYDTNWKNMRNDDLYELFSNDIENYIETLKNDMHIFIKDLESALMNVNHN